MKQFFTQSSTIGVRIEKIQRAALHRSFTQIDTCYGTINVKVSELDGEIVTAKAEYDDCAQLAMQHDVPLSRVKAEADVQITRTIFKQK